MSLNIVRELISILLYKPEKAMLEALKSQVLRYIRAISTVIKWLQKLIKRLFILDKDRTATEKLFLHNDFYLAKLCIDIFSTTQES